MHAVQTDEQYMQALKSKIHDLESYFDIIREEAPTAVGPRSLAMLVKDEVNPARLDVLDKGYVILQDWMGGDKTTVNTARVSFDKKISILEDKDLRLIKFLAKYAHTSPFRHSILQYEIYAPLMVARQWLLN